jgi:Arc/MetJ-type ribon-helix-helix transcriptional regulator
MPKIVAQIPKDIYENMSEEIRLGIFSSASEAINAALRKAYAKKSRTYLKWLIKREDIKESDLLKELASIRK